MRPNLAPKYMLKLSAENNNSQNFRVNYDKCQTVSIQIRPEKLLRLSIDVNGKQSKLLLSLSYFSILSIFLFKCLYSLLFGMRDKISSGNKILPLYKTRR